MTLSETLTRIRTTGVQIMKDPDEMHGYHITRNNRHIAHIVLADDGNFLRGTLDARAGNGIQNVDSLWGFMRMVGGKK